MSPAPQPVEEETKETEETEETQETEETEETGTKETEETEETQDVQETEVVEETADDAENGAFDELADELEVGGLNPEGVTEEDLESGAAGIQTADLSGDDGDGGDDSGDDGDDWFDDVEDGSFDASDSDSGDDASDSDSGVSPGGELDDVAVEVFAALAVSGLPEEEQERLQPELERLYEAMQLGPAFAEFADEYILPDGDEEADPATKLAASAAMCAFVTLQKRPDGTDLAMDGIESASNLIKSNT